MTRAVRARNRLSQDSAYCNNGATSSAAFVMHSLRGRYVQSDARVKAGGQYSPSLRTWINACWRTTQ